MRIFALLAVLLIASVPLSDFGLPCRGLSYSPVAGLASNSASIPAALSLGFEFVASAPLVRSSYHEDGQSEFVRSRTREGGIRN